MEAIPCKVNKCILLPVCIAKETIHCDDLQEYYVSLDVENKSSRTLTGGEMHYYNSREITISVWQSLNDLFPNLTRILSNYKWR